MSGGRFTREQQLAVDGEPRIVAPDMLPEHRILRLWLRNEGENPVELRRGDLVLLGGATDLRASVTPACATIEPGGTAGFDLVYRARGAPTRIDVCGASLAISARAPARSA